MIRKYLTRLKSQPAVARDPIGYVIRAAPVYEWDVVNAPIYNGPDIPDEIHPAIQRQLKKAYEALHRGFEVRRHNPEDGLPTKISDGLRHSAIAQAIRHKRIKDKFEWDLDMHPEYLLYTTQFTTRGD